MKQAMLFILMLFALSPDLCAIKEKKDEKVKLIINDNNDGDYNKNIFEEHRFNSLGDDLNVYCLFKKNSSLCKHYCAALKRFTKTLKLIYVEMEKYGPNCENYDSDYFSDLKVRKKLTKCSIDKVIEKMILQEQEVHLGKTLIGCPPQNKKKKGLFFNY